jgi:hypothetical protein
MDDDMIVRGFAVRTRETYLDVVRGLAKHHRLAADGPVDHEAVAAEAASLSC